MMMTQSGERRVGSARSALDDTVSRRPRYQGRVSALLSAASEEEERSLNVRPGASEKAPKK